MILVQDWLGRRSVPAGLSIEAQSGHLSTHWMTATSCVHKKTQKSGNIFSVERAGLTHLKPNWPGNHYFDLFEIESSNMSAGTHCTGAFSQ